VEDAEDAVHEAMVRAAERANVDDDRLGAWVTSVTVRLCVDRFRQVSREAQVQMRWVQATLGEATVEEAVCDRAEAVWLAGRSGDLPARQAQALSLQAEGLDLSQIAHRTGLSYQAVQSLLARARRTLRAALAGTLAVAVLLWRGRPRLAGGSAQTVALASAAVTLAIAGLGLTSPAEAGAQAEPAQRLQPNEGPFRADPGHTRKGRAAPSEPSHSDPSADPWHSPALPADQGASDAPIDAALRATNPPPEQCSGLVDRPREGCPV
jgi:RNA polymerase sigma factor (sigma-70 family)